MAHRLLVVAGVVRVVFRAEARDFAFHTIDKVIVSLAVWSFVAYVSVWGTGQSVIFQLGRTFDIFGLYFLFRVYVSSPEDLRIMVKTLALACAVFAGFMTIEAVTGRNILNVLGGLPEGVWLRKGRLRCRATFGHPISAGIFGASLIPLWLAGLARGSSFRILAIVGLVSCTIMTLTSASSSSVLTFAAGIFAFFLWRFRQHLSLMRWGVLFTLIALHMVMKAPVWALLQRVNMVGGSTGNYRYRLVDNFINSFSQWWFVGLKDPEETFGMWDLCNQFVLEGIRGGLLRLALFSIVLALCFRVVGRVVRLLEQDRPRAILAWSMGAMLFAHFTAFWGFDYWDQIRVPWYLLLAIIASLPALIPSASVSTGEVEEECRETGQWADSLGQPSPLK
jgi:hypothetical protein